jgi:inorganic pyrophosphatase
MTNSKDFLGKEVTVKIDRSIGDKHSEKYPNHIYPINYGYVVNTISGDGEELDAYILGVFEPLKEFTGICKAIIHRTESNDDKLIIMPKEKNYTDAEIRVLTEFQERFFKSIIIRENDYLEFSKLIPELSVKNISDSIKFFDAAGFKIEYQRPENKFAFLSLDSIQIMIQEETTNDKWEIAPLNNKEVQEMELSKYPNLYRLMFRTHKRWSEYRKNRGEYLICESEDLSLIEPYANYCN